MLRPSQTALTSEGVEMKFVHGGEAPQIDDVNDSHATRHCASYGYGGGRKTMPAEALETSQWFGGDVHVSVVTFHDSTDAFMDEIRRCSRPHVCSERRQQRRLKRVLLYRDDEGNHHNVLLGGRTAGLAGAWSRSLITFSGWEAVTGLVVLARIIACFQASSAARSILLTLVFSLVLSEEMSLSLLNSSILVGGVPSVASYLVHSRIKSDYPRDLVTLLFACAGVSSDDTYRTYFTLTAALLAAAILAANLGARAWEALRYPPVPTPGIFLLDLLLSFTAAAAFGITCPYLGFDSVQAGGMKALNVIIVGASTVLVAIIVSDIDKVQELLVQGSSGCDQSVPNMVIGAWFAIGFLTSIFLSDRIPCSGTHGPPIITDVIEANATVQEDQRSPVGWVVLSLPNISIKPTDVHQSEFYDSYCNSTYIKAMSVLLAAAGCMLLVMIGMNGSSEISFGGLTINSTGNY